MSALPPELERLVVETLERTELGPGARADFEADLRAHLRDGLSAGRSVEELARRFGDPETAARLVARQRPPPSRVRGEAGPVRLESLLADLRLAARAVRRSPSLTLTATLVLALGVGANAVVFSVLNELLLTPLPVAEPERLADVWADNEGDNSFAGFSWEAAERYRAEGPVFERLAAFMGAQLELGDDGPDLIASFVTPEYFDVLEVSASMGVTSFPGAARLGEPAGVVVTHGFWQDALGSDPDVVGSTLRVGGHPLTVLGVGPPGFAGHFIGFPSDVWLPLTSAPLFGRLDPADPSDQPLEMIGRLGDGVTVETAQIAFSSVAAELRAANPDAYRGHGVGVSRTNGLDHSLAPGVTAFVAILATISLLVLLVACLNVGGILLVRATARERELAVRVALGAGRLRLVRALLAESLFLVGLGSVVGVLAALRINDALVAALEAAGPGLGLELGIDARVLALTAGTGTLAALVTAVVPAAWVARRPPAGVLRSQGSEGTGGARLRSMLLVAQVCISVVLVTATGLFTRSLLAGARIEPGFDPDRVGFFAVRPPDPVTTDSDRVRREIVGALRATPGVRAVSVGTSAPVGVRRSPLPIEVAGVAPPPGSDSHVVDVRLVDAGYLDAVGIPLIQGRDIEAPDARTGDRVAVVSSAFRERFLVGGPAIGRSFLVDGEPVTVVGVATDARYLVQDDTPDPLVYLSRPADASVAGDVVVVRADDPAALAPIVSTAVATTLPGHDRVQMRAAREVLDNALLPQRMGVLIVGAMGLAALFLSAVGLYGLVHYTVARSTRELGVRLALGGGRLDLATVVMGRGLRLVAIGTATGVVIGLVAMRGLGPFLNGVSPADPLTYGAVISAFALVALWASWLPARHALRVEPTEALRGE